MITDDWRPRAAARGLGLRDLSPLTGSEVSGQDLSDDAVAQAQTALSRHGLAGGLKVGDATRLQF